LESNYRLLNERLNLITRARPQYVVPDGDGYEPVGISSNPMVEVLVPARKECPEIRMRLGRKQRAARAYIPKETIRIVKKVDPAPVGVAEIRILGMMEIEQALLLNRGVRKTAVKVAQIRDWVGKQSEVKFLEHKIARLMGIIEAPKVAAKLKEDSITRLQELWNIKRKVRAI
jgi:hypothetical protein